MYLRLSLVDHYYLVDHVILLNRWWGEQNKNDIILFIIPSQ